MTGAPPRGCRPAKPLPDARVKYVARIVGPVLGLVNAGLDRVPFSLPLRAALGDRYRVKQDVRLRSRYGVQHDLVDASPEGDRPHTARDPG